MKLKFYLSNISYESIHFYSCDQLKKEGRSLRHTLLQLFTLLNTSACCNMPIDVSILRSKPLQTFIRLLCHSLM